MILERIFWIGAGVVLGMLIIINADASTDLNGDGIVNGQDMIAWLNLGQDPVGDFNCDGVNTGADLAILDAAQGGPAKVKVILTMTEPHLNDDGTALLDLAGYLFWCEFENSAYTCYVAAVDTEDNYSTWTQSDTACLLPLDRDHD